MEGEHKHEHHEHHGGGPEHHIQGEKKENVFKRIYDQKYKQLLIIPLLMLILAIAQISYQTAVTGDFIYKGVSLKGGTTVTLTSEEINIAALDRDGLESYLVSQFPGVDIDVRVQSELGEVTGMLVDATIESEEDLAKFKEVLVDKIPGLTKGEVEENIASMGSSLGQAFFQQTFRAIIIAFILMGAVVFLYFRVPIPSIAVILAALSDIIVTVAIVNLLGMRIGTAGIAAFLMLIGYSVDTDILLSSRVLKRKEGSVLDRTIDAMGTGLTMNITTMSAITVAIIVSQSPDLKQIMTILLIGLLVDIINTWLQNAGILRWYLERKHRGKA